ncbi:disulfide bond formation protein B [Aestuariivirga sp.]|uniref:disulfide bond formation protein B n=1 Tax=Aestuariivirga sp. TaxID=2650926 RepID=UPI003593A4C9
MLKSITPQRAALLILAVAAATIAGAWIFEFAGYAPCDLCLKQRWAYYVAIPLALAVALISPSSPSLARYGLAGLALVWLGSMVFGIFHSGVEWGWWPGPTTCTGTGQLTGGLPDLSTPAVMCDKAAIRILGLSLAGWNAVISLGLAIVAVAGVRAQGSSSVSQ